MYIDTLVTKLFCGLFKFFGGVCLGLLFCFGLFWGGDEVGHCFSKVLKECVFFLLCF